MADFKILNKNLNNYKFKFKFIKLMTDHRKSLNFYKKILIGYKRI